MPKLSDTMTEGRLISWKKSVGEKVSRGDIIAEVETDKANMELEAFVSGVLLETRVKPGEMAPVGTVIAVVGEAGEAVQAQPAKEEAAVPSLEPEKPRPEPAAPAEAAAPAKAEPVAEESAEAGEKEKASPMVRRLARERGIDLAMVKGSGQDGRILKEDLEQFFKEKQVLPPQPGPQPEAEPRPVPSGGAKPLSRMRAAIARTVSRSWREIPHFSVTVAIDMGEAEEVRRELKGSGTPVSVSDMIVKATATALKKFPSLNNSFASEGVVVNGEINIGLAVALEDGLVVPVIRGCDGLSLKEIGERSRGLVERARSGKISEAELAGGTFTISNLGMFGVEEFAAVILPSQGGILATGAVSDEAMVKNGQLVAGRVMRATLSADHRLIDGAYAAQFLGELKKVLENPATMLV
ncbi:MAG TPA: dihydrolipoamide acetyltransferase family protein [Desulfuromonadaceae bacterium]